MTGCGKMLYEIQGVYFSVGAPAFMRGKERFSAPKEVSTLILRFSAALGKSRG
jgi:CheY-specific phosphatase CheX